MTDSEAQTLVDEYAARLGEHFDAVQILVSTAADEGGTMHYRSGSGNWYARQGMAHDFITCEQAEEIARAASKFKEEDE